MRQGFTLIELLIVIAIFFLLAIFIMPVGWSFYQKQILNNTNDQLVGVLKQARSLAISQKNDSSFGVKITANNIILFQGEDFSQRVIENDQMFPFSRIINYQGPAEIIFSSLSGNCLTPGELTLEVNNSVKNISVNQVGLISY